MKNRRLRGLRGRLVVADPLEVSRSTPLIFNAPDTAVAGDIVYVQGDFKTEHAQILLNGTTLLANVASFSTYWVACRIPSTTVGKIEIQVNNGSLSAVRALNKAIAYHLNCTELRPNGPFRVFGRNLKLAGYTATCTVQGLAATVDQDASNSRMLVCTAPAGITNSADVAITVNNGISGYSDSTPDFAGQAISVVSTTPGTSDVFGLGVGWAFLFQTYATTTAIAGLVGDDSTDNLATFNAAFAAASAGTILTIPAGTFRISANWTYKAGVVLRGASKATSIITKAYAGAWSISGGFDGVGFMDLTFRSKNNVRHISWQLCTRSFMKNVALECINVTEALEILSHTNLALVNVDQSSDLNANHRGGLLVYGNAMTGLHMTGGTSIWRYTSPLFMSGASFAYVSGRTITRDLAEQATDFSDNPHGFVFHSTHRIAFMENTINTMNGPYTATGRNDGEAILAEDSGNNTTIGTVSSATATSITYVGGVVLAFPPGQSTYIKPWLLFIVSGPAAGQSRRIVSGVGTRTIGIDTPWDLIPDSSCKFMTDLAVDKNTIYGNTLTDQRTNFMIYNTSARNIDYSNNTLDTSAAAILWHPSNANSAGEFRVNWNMRMSGNVVTAPRDVVASGQGAGISLDAPVLGTDDDLYGISCLGYVVSNCALTGNNPNETDHAGNIYNNDGYSIGSRQQSGTSFVDNGTPGILGPIFQNNTGTFLDEHYKITNHTKRAIIADYTKVSGGTISNNTYVEYANGAAGVPAPNDTIVI